MANDCTHTGEMLLVSKYMTDLLIKDIKVSVNGCTDDWGMALYYQGQLDVLKLLDLILDDDCRRLKDKLK